MADRVASKQLARPSANVIKQVTNKGSVPLMDLEDALLLASAEAVVADETDGNATSGVI